MNVPTITVPGSVQRDSHASASRQAQQQQDIANLAYALWQQRGCPQDSAEQDWIEAEQRLRSGGEKAAISSSQR